MAPTDGPLVAIVDADELSDDQSSERLVRSAGFRIEIFGSAEDFRERGGLDRTGADEAAADSYRKCDAGRRMIGALSSVRVKARADSTAMP